MNQMKATHSRSPRASSQRMSSMMGRTQRENPKDAELPSHRLLLRGGFIRQYTAGVYALLPLARKSVIKIEKIIREEMDRVEGQEISMACLATAELWSESGRYQAIGKDMFRLQDRHNKPMVLNMTHEEPVVFLARTEFTSYKQLPAMVYQIQTKYRDEPRPRGGLIRLREFSMKDAYSFHETEEDLKTYYMRVHEAYERIFKRCGLKNFVSVQSDNGMFGGRFSHEFQLLVPTGEDKLITCSACDYKANLEIATSPFVSQTSSPAPLEKIPTPGMRTIAQLCKFLNIAPETTAKAVMLQDKQGTPVISFVRGDLEIVDKKLQSLVGRELVPAKDEVIKKSGAVAGSTGPIGLNLNECIVAIDLTVMNTCNVVTGANEDDMHWKHFDIKRDFLDRLSPEEKSKVIIGDFAAARPGDPCPECSKPLVETRGIEIGNIFHLGTKYTESMDCTYLTKTAERKNHIMGCYGIGVTRMLPSVIEESNDANGIIFPITVAPMEVHLCALNYKEEPVKNAAEGLFESIKNAGIDVLFDDRDEKAGSQFADADLMGIPFRVVVSPKTLLQNSVEFARRDKKEPARMVPITEIREVLSNEIAKEYAKYDF